jgi:hypothetical protein
MGLFDSLRRGLKKTHEKIVTGLRSVLSVGREVLVVGAVSDLTGEVIVGKPVQSQHKYIISLKNEETLASVTDQAAKNLFVGMVVCGVLGLGLILWDLVF